MTIDAVESLLADLDDLRAVRPVGRVSALSQGLVEVSGLDGSWHIGDRVRIRHPGCAPLSGEVIRIGGGTASVLPEASVAGFAVGDAAERLGEVRIAPHSAWIGRIVDPNGRPLDGRPLLRGRRPRRLHGPPPPAVDRHRLGERLETGTAVFNTFLPIVRGQRIGLFAGSGVGKSSLMGALARRVPADLAVIALIGERGREVREFVETVLGPEGMARSVVVTATSDQSPMLRRQCALAAMAVAEHFRDEGRHVLLLADSVTRFAEAHREIALAAGEQASLAGYPPSMAHQIMALAERAGPGTGDSGDITAVFSVLVAGSDMEGPVADILRGVLDGHVVLDRRIAERGRFPAVDLLRSVSRALPQAASARENALIGLGRRLLGAYEAAEPMIQAGLYAAGSDALVDAALRVWPALDAFLAEAEGDDIAASFARLERILADEQTERG